MTEERLKAVVPDGDQLSLGLPDHDEGVLSRRDLVLSDRVVASQVPGVDPGEVGRLEATSFPVAVAEYAGTIGARY